MKKHNSTDEAEPKQNLKALIEHATRMSEGREFKESKAMLIKELKFTYKAITELAENPQINSDNSKVNYNLLKQNKVLRFALEDITNKTAMNYWVKQAANCLSSIENHGVFADHVAKQALAQADKIAAEEV